MIMIITIPVVYAVSTIIITDTDTTILSIPIATGTLTIPGTGV